MKLIKRIPFQMFVLNLFAGIVCITGMFIMRYNLNEIVESYEQKIEGSLNDRLSMAEICRQMNRHHVIVSWHTLTDSPDAKLSYEEEAAEQLFHTVYSNSINYFNNAENVFQMSSEGSSATAAYYVNSFLADFIDKITQDIDVVDGYIADEMDEAGRNMERSIAIAEVSEKLCIACICLVMVVCMVMCVSITSKLEKYKNQLEEENERKTQALIEHNERMLALQENTIIGMANLIENRDSDTGEHVKRTSRYVELLARAARKAGYCEDILTDDYSELLVKAAPMHDIGKIAEGHHEKWDGSGYPKGLKKSEIPLCARIMAVADVFDALVSKRCYKEAMPVERAFGIIRESGGSHFDPKLAELFCDIRSEVEEVLRQF